MPKVIKIDNYDKNVKYAVGVSGGPDSMVLLDSLREAGYHLVVCHFNYKVRKSADRDQKIVEDYCRKYKIKLYLKKPDKKEAGNFEAQARDERYSFYAKVMKKENCVAVFLGHHQDDLIETYWMQEEKNSEYSYWGIRKKGKVNGLLVLRPLLGYTKEQLENYAKSHKLEYGIDETNNDLRYTRNKLRPKVKSLDPEERKEILKEIKTKNDQLEKEQRQVRKDYSCLTKFKPDKYLGYPLAYREKLLRYYLMDQGIEEAFHYSKAHLEQMDKQLCSLNNQRIKVNERYNLDKDYQQLYLKPKAQPYKYEIKEIKEIKTPYFKVSHKGKSTEGVCVLPEEFPLTIRSPKPGDEIALRFGKKKINRWFIDRKIPAYLRERWPIVVNAQGKIVLVPGIGCAIDNYGKIYSLFVVNLVK